MGGGRKYYGEETADVRSCGVFNVSGYLTLKGCLGRCGVQKLQRGVSVELVREDKQRDEEQEDKRTREQMVPSEKSVYHWKSAV